MHLLSPQAQDSRDVQSAKDTAKISESVQEADREKQFACKLLECVYSFFVSNLRWSNWFEASFHRDRRNTVKS